MSKKKLKFYTVTKEYMQYLKKFESKIMDNEGKKEKRPYLGVIIKIDENSYFAPLSSPKPKHLKLKKSIDFVAIDNGVLGGINLNNMIPVKDGFFKENDIEKEADEKYKSLIRKQLTWCNENKEKIIKKAEKLHSIITTKRENSKIWNRCCDFSLLEEKALEYGKPKELIPYYNPLTGHELSLCPEEAEKLNKVASSSSAWISEGDVKKHNIELKENATPVSVKVFSLSKEENKPCIKDITIYNVAQLNITKELSVAFKEPVKKEKQVSISKQKDTEIER